GVVGVGDGAPGAGGGAGDDSGVVHRGEIGRASCRERGRGVGGGGGVIGQGGGHARVVLHDQGLVAGAGGRGVEGVAGVDGLPVPGAGGGEGVGRGVRGPVVGQRARARRLGRRDVGASGLGVVGVGDGAPGAGGGAGDDSGVVHRG